MGWEHATKKKKHGNARTIERKEKKEILEEGPRGLVLRAAPRSFPRSVTNANVQRLGSSRDEGGRTSVKCAVDGRDRSEIGEPRGEEQTLSPPSPLPLSRLSCSLSRVAPVARPQSVATRPRGSRGRRCAHGRFVGRFESLQTLRRAPRRGARTFVPAARADGRRADGWPCVPCGPRARPGRTTWRTPC